MKCLFRIIYIPKYNIPIITFQKQKQKRNKCSKIMKQKQRIMFSYKMIFQSTETCLCITTHLRILSKVLFVPTTSKKKQEQPTYNKPKVCIRKWNFNAKKNLKSRSFNHQTKIHYNVKRYWITCHQIYKYCMIWDGNIYEIFFLAIYVSVVQEAKL